MNNLLFPFRRRKVLEFGRTLFGCACGGWSPGQLYQRATCVACQPRKVEWPHSRVIQRCCSPLSGGGEVKPFSYSCWVCRWWDLIFYNILIKLGLQTFFMPVLTVSALYFKQQRITHHPNCPVIVSGRLVKSHAICQVPIASIKAKNYCLHTSPPYLENVSTFFKN